MQQTSELIYIGDNEQFYDCLQSLFSNATRSTINDFKSLANSFDQFSPLVFLDKIDEKIPLHNQSVDQQINPFIVLVSSLETSLIEQESIFDFIDPDEKVEIIKLRILKIVRHYHDRLALNSSKNFLRTKMEDWQEFSYVAAHDLKSPMRVIHRSADLLIEEYDDLTKDEVLEYLQKIKDRGNWVRTLIASIEEYIPLDSELITKPIDLNEACQEALDNLAAKISGAQAEIKVGEICRVDANRNQMVLVFQNLIGNSLKFCSPTQAPIIEISTSGSCEDMCTIEVKDNGVGFDSENLGVDIFSAFTRLHSHEKYPGSGMGLTICRKIIEAHGGEISVCSKPEEGAIFRFTVPRVHGKIDT